MLHRLMYRLNIIYVGLAPKSQAAPRPVTAVDKKYDVLEKEGKLASAPWAANLPW